MKTTTKKRLLLIPVYILVFLVLWVAASFVSIEVRYRAHEKKILNHPSEASEEYYYFNQLTYKEQLLFKSIKDAAEKHENESEIVPYRYTEDEFKRVAKAVSFDCPMLFYLDPNSFKLFCDEGISLIKELVEFFEFLPVNSFGFTVRDGLELNSL